MRILIVYATTEGHTRKLARFLSKRFSASGHVVQVCDAGAIPPGPELFDAVILAGSVHILRYQAALVRYARRHRDALNNIPSAFISVSLAAASDKDLAGLRACVARLERQTRWRPTETHHAAGAMPFSAYGPLTRFAIKTIAKQHGMVVDASRDYDLTDYGALCAFADALVARVSGKPASVAWRPRVGGDPLAA